MEHLYGEFSTVFTGREPLEALEHRGDRTAIVLELLGAVLDANIGPPADVLVVGALVGILKAPLAANVVDQDHVEISAAGLHVVDQTLQRITAGNS